MTNAHPNITKIEIVLTQGEKEPLVLGFGQYWNADLSGEEMSNTQQAKAFLDAYRAATEMVEKNMRLWGAEGILMEAASRRES